MVPPNRWWVRRKNPTKTVTPPPDAAERRRHVDVRVRSSTATAGKSDDRLGSAAHRRVDHLARRQRRDAAAGRRCQDLVAPTPARRRSARRRRRSPAPATGGSPCVRRSPVALPRRVSAARPSRSRDVGEHRHHRRRQARRAGGDERRTRAQSSTASSGAAEVARQVGLAEPDRRDHLGDRRSPHAASTPSAVSISAVNGTFGRAQRARRRRRRATRPWARARRSRRRRRPTPRGRRQSRAFTRTSTTGGCPRRRPASRRRRARLGLVVGGDGILEVEDHEVGAGRHRLVEALRPVAGTYSPGTYEHDGHTAPSLTQLARSRRR